MDFTNKFINKYGKNYILSKCKENKCVLKDVKKEEYLIINGDEFKESDNEKSVDCIIIELRENDDGKHRIILCELTSGAKLLSTTKEKFESSGKLIIETMNELNESIFQINCLLLGKIKQNGKSITQSVLNHPINIIGYDGPTFIQNESCGFSITSLN